MREYIIISIVVVDDDSRTHLCEMFLADHTSVLSRCARKILTDKSPGRDTSPTQDYFIGAPRKKCNKKYHQNKQIVI